MKLPSKNDGEGKSGDPSEPELFPLEDSAPLVPSGYHERPEGTRCPRGHRAPLRDNRCDCSECHRERNRALGLTRRAALSVIYGAAIPPAVSRVIGATGKRFLEFLETECARMGLRLESYGRTWGIYRRRPLAKFNLADPAEYIAANRLGNLRVARLHNRPKHEPEPEVQLTLFAGV